jgi:hypothetical protein
MEYNIERFELFFEAYRKGLAAAMKKYPDEYMPGLDSETIADRIIAKVKAKGIEAVTIAQSKGFKHACKEFGIKQTYKEITKYLMGN